MFQSAFLFIIIRFSYFESLMCFLLNNYFKTSQEMTEKVLTSRIPLWRNQTLIEVAGDIGLKHFIGSPGSRAVLEKQWSEVTVFSLSKYNLCIRQSNMDVFNTQLVSHIL